MRSLLVVLLLISVALAGCAKDEAKFVGAESGGDPDVEPISDVVVETESGKKVAQNRGIVSGIVQNELGKGVPEAFVFLVDTEHTLETGVQGTFLFKNVTPGPHIIRAEHDDLSATELPIQVVAGKEIVVNLTLLKPGSLSPDASIHAHNMWGGRTEVTIMEEAVDLFPDYSLKAQVMQFYSRSLTYANLGDTSGYEYPIILPDEGPEGDRALIFPGTTELEVTFTWTSDDTNLEELRLIYSNASSGDDIDMGFKQSGDPWIIPVDPQGTDNGHQEFTHWDFHMRSGDVRANGDPGLFYPDAQLGVKIVIRGGDPPLEPAHPDFWGDNDTLVIEATGAPNPAVTKFYREPDGSGTRIVMRDIIPPGTAHIRAEFSWTHASFDQSVPGLDWAITWRTADQHPYYTPFSEYRRVDFTEGSHAEQYKVYEFDVEDEWNDAWYQKRSIWSFLISREGEQDSYDYYQEQRVRRDVPEFALKLTLTKEADA